MQHGKFSIWIVSPPGYSHSRCFEEIALGLREAFAALGVDAQIVTAPERAGGTVIVLGSNILAERGLRLPPGCILYNLEQISPESSWLTESYIALPRNYRVWDYSKRNISALAALGVTATLCEIGYMPGLTRITPAPVRDIDVLFIGSLNERRRSILQELTGLGLNVFAGFGLYGGERDAMFARAKVVLNLHYYESKVLEIARISYLLANRMCVVSETGSDLELEAELKDGVSFAPYKKLTETCLRLLANDGARRAIAETGFKLFSARSQVPMLKAALATFPNFAAGLG